MTNNDRNTSIATLIRAVEQFRYDREWEQFHSPRNLAMSISIEAAELLEIFQWKSDDAVDFNLLNRATNELADVIIYCLNFASVTGIDITSAVQNKMQHNAIKYPVKKDV